MPDVPDILNVHAQCSGQSIDAESGTPRFQFRWLLAALLPLTVLLSSCDSTQDVQSTAQQTNTDVPNRNFAILVGRMGQSGDTEGGGTEQVVPLPGVTIYAYSEGQKISTTSNDEGFWSLANIPVTASGTNGSDNNGGNTLTLYFEKTGWYSDSTSVTVASVEGTQSSSFQVDLGPRYLSPLTLGVTSNVIHDGTLYLTSSSGVANNTLRDYLSDPVANITLTFNMPVDTTYTGTSFVELVAPDGTLVAFTGSWSSNGMTFTIDPAASLTADSNDATRYRVRFVHIARAVNGITSFSEIQKVQIVFNVVSPTHGGLLATQAPSVAPQLDTTTVGGITGSFTSYEFDSTAFFRTRTINGNTDYVDAGNNYTANTMLMTWPTVSGASSYNLYYRNTKTNAGDWTLYPDHNVILSSEVGPNNVFVRNVDLSQAMGGDSQLTGNESIDLLVTAVNSDGVESPLAGVTRLVVADTRNPTVTSASTSGRLDASPLNTTSKVNLTANFSEIMGTTASGQPLLASLSGLMSSIDVSSATLSWTSTSSWKATGANLTFTATGTTLGAAANIADTSLKLASVGKLMVGDSVLIGNASGFDGPFTISQVASADNRIDLASGLTKAFSPATPVRLVSSANVTGLTYHTPTALSANALQGTTTLTVADGSKLYPTMDVNIWRQDESGYYNSAGPYTLTQVSGNTLTLSAPLNVPLNAGSLVVYSQVGAVSGGGANATPIQPTPRATANGTLAYDVQFDTNAVSTTLAANVQSAAPADGSPTTILVADSTGIGAGDYITIAASSASSTLAADLNNVSTSIGVATGTGSTFRVGDILRIPGETASATTGTVVIAGATSLPVTPVMTVVVGDTVNVSDAKFTTTLSAASAAAVTTITVTSAAGLAGGQSVTISDAFQTSETVTIASIAGTTATLSAGLAGSWGSGSQVTRNAIGPNPYTVQTATAISPITLTAVLPALSTQAQVTLMRRTEDVRVTAIATDTLTVVRLGTPQAADYHRMGTQIALLSQPEVRRVTAITSNILTLNSALGFMHRAAAAVNKQPQGVMVFSTLPTNIVIGDTVVIDMLSIATFADTVADRVQATIQAIDTLTKSVTVTTAAARTRVDYTTATVTFMGDAVVVSGAVDSNGNTVRSTSGNRVNLSNGTSK